MSAPSKDISFIIDGILFEYDEEKNRLNIQKHTNKKVIQPGLVLQEQARRTLLPQSRTRNA